MKADIEEFLKDRTNALEKELREKDKAFALAQDKSVEYFERVEPFLTAEGDCTFTAADAGNLRDLFNNEVELEDIFQRFLYRQGFLDCVTLLRMLGVLPSGPR